MRFKREGVFLNRMLRASTVLMQSRSQSTRTVADLLEVSMDRHATRAAIEFEGRTLTYGDLEAQANRVSRWALNQGLRRGDVVALFIETRPEFFTAWFGLAKIGVVTALINAQLSGESLAHCIRIANAKAVVIGAELLDAWRSASTRSGLPSSVWCWADGQQVAAPADGLADLDRALAGSSTQRPDRDIRDGMTNADPLLYIFTSGTTGLPKAATIRGARGMALLCTFGRVLNIRPDDRVYVCLPHYHASGGLCGVGSALTRGACMVLRRRFSASRFWTDVKEQGVTAFIYIGELFRYLVNQPDCAEAHDHKIRVAFGSGLRPEVWEQVEQRFGIRDVVEFYGATEGNVSLINFDGRRGAVGRIPPYLKRLMPVKIVRFDHDAEAPLRNGTGHCVEADIGEAGEAIGRIGDNVREKFDGYVQDNRQTAAKILSDVFAKGDRWYRTGDLLRRDADGYFYFVDRIGDTFRWKAENVSTSEVARVAATAPGVLEAIVYGVEVPGNEGRAGMAALVVDPARFTTGALAAHMERDLPRYARPLFLRLCSNLCTTGTFKYRKQEWIAEGYDPTSIADPLFILDADTGLYSPLDAETHGRLLAGTLKV